MRPFEEIIKLLRDSKIKYQEVNHEAVYTSEQAAAVRGMDMHAGAKSLLLKGGDEFIFQRKTVPEQREGFILAVLPGDKRLDTKKLKQILKVKDIRFASPTEINQIMGCEIGACYPFGSVAGVKMVVDPTLGENEIISFNPGVHNKSIQIKWLDFIKITNPILVEITI